MAPVAGHTNKVYAKSADSSVSGSDELAGIASFETEHGVNLLETTAFKDATGNRTRIAGLKDFSASMSGDYEQADSPQALLRSEGSTVYITIIYDPNASAGSQGFRYPCLVENWKISGEVDGKTQINVSLKANGAARTAV